MIIASLCLARKSKSPQKGVVLGVVLLFCARKEGLMKFTSAAIANFPSSMPE